jgi:hypothetical protein
MASLAQARDRLEQALDRLEAIAERVGRAPMQTAASEPLPHNTHAEQLRSQLDAAIARLEALLAIPAAESKEP